ncbi:hypothetical protein Halar_2134 [halophilic archaeon DL31]|jgi:hypothetical protein|nr:hypothetical protein Halar_2134 [halophilic archaeon DL31]
MTRDLPTADRSSPRELWGHEAHDFTPWLAEHIDQLGEAIGRELTVQETERSTPTGFSLDLFVEDVETGESGAVEVQLEQSDHRHLGQLLTYVTAFESEFAVWVVHGVRYEHQRAIEWVNESSDKTAYLVNIEAVTIHHGDDHDGVTNHNAGPAPLFTLLTGPSEEARKIGEQKRQLSERDTLQLRFHEGVKDHLPDSFTLFDNVSPKSRQYISARINGVSYAIHITDNGGYAQLYIDVGEEDENNALFDKLKANQEETEQEIGHELIWMRMPGNRACRIHTSLTDAGLRDQDQWSVAQEQLARQVSELYEVFNPQIQSIR